MITHQRLFKRVKFCFQCLPLLFTIAIVLLDRVVLKLQILALSLKCRVLVLDEPKALLEYRRTAVLVDKRLNQFKYKFLSRLVD